MDGFNFIDIILFAMIAAFLILRLRNVLGRRDGHEPNFRDMFNDTLKGGNDNGNKAGPGRPGREDDNVVRIQGSDDENTPSEPAERPEAEELDLTGMDETLATGVTQIRRHDPAFTPSDFVSGARIAFEMILGAYADGDENTLQPLLSPEVFANFSQAIRDRKEAGEDMKDILVGINSADVVEAYMEDAFTNVTVKFVSEQINVVIDADGEVVDGDPDRVISVTDFWTFARDSRTNDPNWVLVATRSLD